MKRFALVSLGCPKNLVDSEYICERFMDAGYILVHDARAADLVVVNTCSFLTSAVQESIDTILELAGAGKEVICAGCLVSRYHRDILEEIPEVGLCAGPGSYDGIVQAYESGDRYLEPAFSSVVSRSYFSGTASAYVKVSEGCSNHCHYCLIPSIRGELVSKPPGGILEECRTLAASGAREIILVAQDLGSYGRDLGIKDGLVRLVDRISAIDAVEWIRIMYVHPASLNARLVRQIDENPKVCPYIDLPIQHVSEKVLRSMGRRGGARAVRHAFDLIGGASREIWVRTSLMVGHPGEDEKAYAELEAFVALGRIHHLGIFVYSPEAGTRSAARKDIPPGRTALRRKRAIMSLQQRLSKKRLHKMKGERIQVLIEGYHPETDLLLKGRAPFMAPEIDGMVVINEGGADAGVIAEAEITGSWEYDLIGRIV
ncbi:MAG TPA: 30S ribosomal protein S12 methylthiotransferase RimO [Deltaproteobacteria bacterium]|nr:30S ribosomal protein S12 methylthiotransferase RimO [Deltaproteobacteria bacterium]HPR56545.1 30S ribosomal protein S12 methylthiotransferase RimO [Deltaproteobacteria bacterium]HXK47960.1 30S ribosomal protein S12 methylthiotransferase RimO [Deltaproteobacteria bacterium]